jgi:mannose-6-phosphate isomerase-like protein (cupin superfamily)
MNYKDIIVKKPWGYEYLVYQNEHVGLWLLHVKKDQRTSMHCHPKKNTGLILLDGECEISFLNDKFNLKSLSKMMIRRGLFHSTKALSDDGIFLFEIEAPRMKSDLVRLKDKYGRAFTPYEGKTFETKKDDSCLWIEDGDCEKGVFKHFNSYMNVQKCFEHDDLFLNNDNDLLMCFRGGLKTVNEDLIYQPGDVITGKTYNQLKEDFDLIESSIILTISK